ncbi:MAG: DUF1236 domain-containing protein [Bradyrhizobium sp.]|nr:DUF1236 domain-containing protein [Bradyrhizobium sp.]
MTNRFLISVATAALIAGTGFANAQGAGGMSREGGAGSSVQQSAPSAGGGAAQSAPQHRETAPPSSGMKSSQSDKAPAAAKQAEDMKAGKDMKAEGREGREKGTVGQAPAEKSGTTTTQSREEKGGAMGHEDRMGQKGEKSSTDTNRAQQNQGTMENNRAQTNQSGSQTTTGNAATSARVAAPPAEKQTQIVSAIKSERIQETNVNVNVAVGTVLPASVRFVPLPPRIVEIYPEWRGYDVVLIHGRYVIVRPQTREIVYIIEG